MFTDPIIPLTIATVLAWLAIIAWKLRRREPAYGVNRGPVPRPEYGLRGVPRAPRWEDDEWDEDEPGHDDRTRYDDEPPLRPFPGVAKADHAEVEINPGKCMRFAFCEHEAPEIFKLVGDRIDYKPSVPADHVEAAAMAVKVCPARAIKIKMPGTKPYLPQPPVDDDERRPIRR